MSTHPICNVVVIGAGQAGLFVSYYLKCAALPHRVLERSRVGESWRSQRWDSFTMNTPNVLTVMPDSVYNGSEPEGFLKLEDFIAVLDNFALRNQLPVETGVQVIRLERHEQLGIYRITTTGEVILTRNVVVASGCLNRPRTPRIATQLPSYLLQIHSAAYRSASFLPDGSILVVGSGSSGGQIAEDLVEAGRTVYLATSRVPRLPRRHRGRDTVCWDHESGFQSDKVGDLPDPSMRFSQHSLLSGTHNGRAMSLQSLSAGGVILLGKLTGFEAGCLIFAEDLEHNIRHGDQAAATAKQRIDAYIRQAELEIPEDVPQCGEIVPPRIPNPSILSLDPIASGISAVVWCTGFDGDFGWIHLPVFDLQGWPNHIDGITALPGVCFTGLHWLSARNSNIITGVAVDAHRIANYIRDRCFNA
jgi:putative flavoprotein involved in K+ transport